MKLTEKIILFAASAVLVASSVAAVLNLRSSNQETIEVVDSLIVAQAEKEKLFKTKNYDINNPNIIIDPYDNSPLSALVSFETKDKVSPTITVHGKDELTTFSNTFESAEIHHLPVYGLYPDTNNKVTIKAGDEIQTIHIKTTQLPEDFITPTAVLANKDQLSNDLYFFTPSSRGKTVAYDVNGDVRWYLTNQAPWKIDRVDNGRLVLSTERQIHAPYYTTGLYEMDLLGKIYVEYSLPGGYHHDYYEMKNGNLLVASDDFLSDAGTVEDIIVELDRKTGEAVKTFDLKDILNMEDGKSESWTAYDWFHNNSVWFDEATNSITLSGRHQDAVINIDYDTGGLNWIIGDSTGWSDEYQKYFFTPIGELEWQWSQHAAMITPEGYVFILDNGNNKSKIANQYVSAADSYTRGVIYEINTDDMTIRQVWQYGKERGSAFYSPYISDVDYLAENHYIVHSGGIVYKDGKVQNQPAGIAGADKLVSSTVEILNNEVIFEIELPTNNYRVEKMKLYTDKEAFSLGKARRLGTLGKTPDTQQNIGFILNSQNAQQILDKHEISITNEGDRLTFEGRFGREDDLKIVLYKNLRSNIYEVPISKKPYTALCVDIFTEEENEKGITVTKHINSEGLSGKHSIYIELNGVLYNTEKAVDFS